MKLSTGKKVVFILWVLVGFPFLILSQKVTVSNEINIKANYAYDIFPNIKGNILFYHDRGTEHLIEIYDDNLKYKTTRDIDLPSRQAKVVNMIKADTVVNVFFQWKEENNSYLSVSSLDQNGNPLDTIKTIYTHETIFSPSIRHAHSEDNSLIVFFWVESRFFHYLVVTNDTETRIVDKGRIESKEFNFKSDFVGLELTNEGRIFLLGQKERAWHKLSDQTLLIMTIQNNSFQLRFLTTKEYEISQVKCIYDQENQQLCVGGLLSKKGEDASIGYFVSWISGNETNDEIALSAQTFSMEFISEIYGKKSNKIKKISDVYLEDILVRKDGGMVLILEIKKEFLRRAGSSAMSRFGDVYSGRGFIDYYNEDLILLSNHPDGGEHWKKVLYKKQFSQDDNAIYSSYFLFRTPSRIKLIYNDEIKTNNTVSEYVLDPLGNFERKSVLSTQYQNLKLRFKDAIQLSSNAIIVPSENINRIHLVKIEYE